ncbi:protein of unknown function [Xenorhabdus doucetiae]|uniref:Uncharacterized protein n=1 Tax=Xenorhabdus doucetiae TaxID=351671 RepID=A0A068QMD1_9GAMM|nr:protein of unknown function [Xenorhabdus doucetiae]
MSGSMMPHLKEIILNGEINGHSILAKTRLGFAVFQH